MKLKILKYNRNKAKWLMALLKFSELFGLFLFVFGFYGLGIFVCENFLEIISSLGWEGITYFDIWFIGVWALSLALSFLVGIYMVGWLIYKIFEVWFKANWRWAKALVEDKKSKEERLKEQDKLKLIKEIEKKEKQREKFGYCVGDIAVMVKDGNFEKAGTKLEIVRVNLNGTIDCKVNGIKYEACRRKQFKFIKKPLPKKPKLK